MKSRFMSFVHPESQEMSNPNPVLKLVGARNVYSLGIKRAFGLFQNVKRPALFNATIPFCVSFSSEFNPINTSSIFDISLWIMRSRFYTNDTFDWSIDVKLKLKVGVVFVTVEQQVLCL